MFWQVLITIGASQAFTLSLLLLLKRQRGQADYLLSLEMMLMFTISMLYNYHEELMAWNSTLPLFPLVLGYLAVPVFYLYTQSASRGNIDLGCRRNLLHLLPFLGANLLVLAFFQQLDPAVKQTIMTNIHDNISRPAWFLVLYYGLFLVIFPYYILRSYLLLRKHENYILTKFSYTENISLAWLNRFLWGMGLVWLAFVFFEVIGNSFFSLTGELGFQIAFIFMIGNIFFLGIYGLRQQEIFFDPQEADELEPMAGEAEKYAHSSLTEERANQYLQQLKDFMETEKPYLEPRITIAELAQRMDIPVNYLSQVINDKLDQNFFDFINTYRVEEFKRLVADPGFQHYTLLSLAYEAGFNSKSTFNAIFKKITGRTPSDYARELQPGGMPA